jgi:hypothetical protein
MIDFVGQRDREQAQVACLRVDGVAAQVPQRDDRDQRQHHGHPERRPPQPRHGRSLLKGRRHAL